MEAWREFSLLATAWLQEMYPGAVGAMRIVSDFGRFEAYLALLPLLYWCIHKKHGTHLTYLLLVSSFVNVAVKHFGRLPRPYWFDPDLGLSAEAGYGAPSNHVQTTTVALLLIAGWARRGWVWLLALLGIGLMTLSRIYLGVHFLFDAALGFVLALGALVGYAVWFPLGGNRFRHLLFGQRLLYVVGVPLGLLLLYVYIMAQIGPPDRSVAWAFYIDAAEAQQIDDIVQMVALMFGVGIGFTYERARVGFVVGGPLWQRGLRYVVGMVGTLAIWQGLGIAFDAITPTGTLWLALPLRFVRYSVLGLWVAYYAPWLFVRLRLASQSSESEMGFTVAGATVPPPKE